LAEAGFGLWQNASLDIIQDCVSPEALKVQGQNASVGPHGVPSTTLVQV
jgi:hypothetical protein